VRCDSTSLSSVRCEGSDHFTVSDVGSGTEVAFDLIDHWLVISTTAGLVDGFALEPMSVASLSQQPARIRHTQTYAYFSKSCCFSQVSKS
jgi:hypothetical protein